MSFDPPDADINSRTECLSAEFTAAPIIVPHCTPQPPSDSACETLSGYRLLEPIGAGGYGTVWRAEAPGGLAKAVKIVHGQFDEKRAADEWKALRHVKGVRHPFLLSLERIEIIDQQLIVVTELADGSLKDCYNKHLAAGRPGIPRDELLGYLAEAADALDYMSSEHGLQHLDVKPENLLLVGNHVKVADFGLVKNLQGSSNSIVGGLTPLFSAPETFDGRPSDRSDQYSLAIVYCYLLCGKCPFPGQSFAQLASQHLHARPDLAFLPESDRSVIERALAKDPFDRFPTCQTLVDRLRSTSAMTSRKSRAPEASAAHPSAAEPTAKSSSTKPGANKPAAPSSDTERVGAKPATKIHDLPPISVSGEHRLQPTLFIGLGSCGIRALSSLERRLRSRFGSSADLPSIRMLAIDTDDASRAMADATSRSDDDEPFLFVPLKPTQYYRKQADDLTRWLNRRWIYNIPRTLKTEGIRPLGRLALVDHAAAVEQRLRSQCAAILQPESLAATSAAAKQAIENKRLQVVVVGSISSGTSGGMVWDIVQLVNQAVPRDSGVHADIVCVLAHWTTISPKEVELSTANTCAALLELHHYMTEGCPGDPSIHLPAVGRHHGLFNNVYVVDLGAHDSQNSFDAAAGKLADYLEANLLSPSAQFLRISRTPDPAAPRSPQIRTFGITRISDSDLAAVEKRVRQLIDPTIPPERQLAAARRRAIDQFLSERLEATHPTLLAGNVARRFLIATSRELQRAGFAGLVQHHLPATASAVTQADEGIIILCECENLTPAGAASCIAQNRPDLLALASRLVTRSDVAWVPL